MRLTLHFLASAVAAGVLATPLASRADDGISVYTVPKDQPTLVAQAVPPPAGGSAAMPAADIPVNSGHIKWVTPSTWKELPPTSIRIGNFAVQGQDGAKAEVAIFSFPGSVGTELGNVNRWRNEVKLPPIEADKIVADPVSVDGNTGKFYEIIGPSQSIVVVSLSRDGAMWFIKMMGDKDVVVDAEPVFRDFLKTIQFGGGGVAAQATQSAAVAAAESNPHGDVSGGAPPPADADSALPILNIPEHWAEKEPGPMILKRYDASDAAGHTAAVTVSSFPGDVGGIFANVNRWRGQMGLQPIDENQLPQAISTVNADVGAATMVDLTGTDARTGNPARMIAIMVPHAGSTWFYKLMGNDAVVEAQKDKFINFVKTARYP